MRWVRQWWRRRRGNGEAAAALTARLESERKLAEVRRMGDEVQAVAARLNEELAANGFAALVEAAFRGRR